MKSFKHTSAPTWPQITSALGAAASHSLSDPHSSDSKLAEADVAQLGKADELGDGLANFRVHSAQPGVEQQRFIVFHQKMVELQIARLRKDRDAIDIRRDFRGDRHTSLLNRIS